MKPAWNQLETQQGIDMPDINRPENYIEAMKPAWNLLETHGDIGMPSINRPETYIETLKSTWNSARYRYASYIYRPENYIETLKPAWKLLVTQQDIGNIIYSSSSTISDPSGIFVIRLQNNNCPVSNSDPPFPPTPSTKICSCASGSLRIKFIPVFGICISNQFQMHQPNY